MNLEQLRELMDTDARKRLKARQKRQRGKGGAI